MSDRTDQGRALVADLEHRARIRGYGLEGQAAEWLSWALDRIAALEGALRSGVDGLSQGSCCSRTSHATPTAHSHTPLALQGELAEEKRHAELARKSRDAHYDDACKAHGERRGWQERAERAEALSKTLQGERDAAREALTSLRNECRGLLGAFKPELVEAISVTNVRVLERKVADADAALGQPTEPQPSHLCPECHRDLMLSGHCLACEAKHP